MRISYKINLKITLLFSVSGSATSCSLGIIASFYSVVGVGVVYARDQEDSFNTFIAAATTGALYKSTAGLKASGIGAAVGLGLAALYTVATAADEHQNLWGKFKYNRL